MSLSEGSKVPDFNLIDQNGENIKFYTNNILDLISNDTILTMHAIYGILYLLLLFICIYYLCISIIYYCIILMC